MSIEVDIPKVSVVTTVYNGAPYIAAAATSILQQSYQDFEWLLVDDGSTDGTPALLAELTARDQRVRRLSPGRIGRARALNLAVENASGTYIAIQDIDDTSRPDRLRLQVEYLDRNPQVGLVGGSYELDDRSREEHYVRMPPTDHEGIIRSMASHIPFAHTLVMFRKEAWRRAGGYPPVNDCIDLELWLTMATAGCRFHNLSEILGKHVVHRESFWHRNFTDSGRQHTQARVQLRAIRQLGLPFWMIIYPAGRYIYPYLPVRIKRLLRRTVVGSREEKVDRVQG